MGCSASHEEPPRQQPTAKKPTAKQDANLHPSYPKQEQAGAPPIKTKQIEAAPPTSNDKQPPPQKVELTKEILERYLFLEKEIHRLEGKNVVKALKAKADNLAIQEAQVKELEERLKKCILDTKKEKADVDQLGEDGVAGLVASDETLAEEQKEYIDAFNTQEIAKKELDEAIRQRDAQKADLEKMRESSEEVNKLLDERDEILTGIFHGDYGSDKENKLEGELDLLLDRKQRIGVAKYKWQNGRVLIQYAVNQLGFGVKRWIDVQNTPKENAKARYTFATEVRNNLVAANQNITSGQRYLSTISFPYCKPAEMETLTRATNNLYTDMQTPDRHAHALNVYNVTHKRSAALLQWFDHVIKSTIIKDSTKANKEAQDKERELQAERILLIKQKVKEVLGQDVELEVDTADDDEAEEELMVLAAKTGGEGEEKVSDDQAENREGPSPLPMDELAPLPSNDDLFGNIDELKKQHEKEMEEFERQQELNKARVEQGLQDKLARRRSRRRRAETKEE